MKNGAKIGIIAAAWVVYFLIGIVGNVTKGNEQADSTAPQTSYSIQETTKINGR